MYLLKSDLVIYVSLKQFKNANFAQSAHLKYKYIDILEKHSNQHLKYQTTKNIFISCLLLIKCS